MPSQRLALSKLRARLGRGDAWPSSAGHAAEIAAPPGAFTVWNSYITGRTRAVEPGRRIPLSWRPTKFVPSARDSQIELLLEPEPGGTRVTVRHGNVPDGHTSYRDGGWQQSYFQPMKRGFAGGPSGY